MFASSLLQKIGMVVCAVLALCGSCFGAGQQPEALLFNREIILPMQDSARKGGVVPYGYSNVTTDEKTGVVRVESTGAGDLAFIRWIPNHLPLNVAEITAPTLRLMVVLKASGTVPVKASWRLKGDEGKLGPDIQGVLQPGKNGTVEALLPVPPVPSGEEVNAIYLAFPESKSVEVQRVALVTPVDMLLDVKVSSDAWKPGPVRVSGRGATPGGAVRLSFKPKAGFKGTALDLDVKANREGVFEDVVENERFIPGDYTVAATEPKSGKVALAVEYFLFPALTGKAQLPAKIESGKLTVGGKPFAFLGANYSGFHLGMGRKGDCQEIVRNVTEMRDWGLRALRVPINISFIQPDEGIFPDNPKFAEAMRSHHLEPEFIKYLDYFVQLAGQSGIYCVMDWHGMPIDPYFYHQGGQEQDRNSGKPGTASAWLAPTLTQAVEFDPSNPRHQQALFSSHAWLAGHFKGNPNILGFEVPYNEPHDRWMAVETNWRKVTDGAAAAVQSGDPNRLTFTMPSAYGHDNLSASATWLPVDRVSGAAPHFYLANGPVPLRPNAKETKQPWLAHDAATTFAYAQAAIFLPYSAANYPIYNGEMGEYGNEDFLPMEKFPDRAEWVIEAQIVQAYAAGWNGALDWTLWGHPTDFMPYREIYARVFKRFAPVYAAGPLDRSNAEIAFVQSPGAVSPENGMNYAAVPFAKLCLAVHLPMAHYFTDQQFLYSFRASVPTGLEQVEEGVSLNRYKAVIVDRRNMDARAISLAKVSGVPVLWTDDAARITPQEFAEFLTSNGVVVDTRTPEGIQVVEGASHLLLYVRQNEDFKGQVYPHVKRKGSFRLVDEAGQEVFTGDAAALAEKGVDLSLPRWRTAIYQFSSSK